MDVDGQDENSLPSKPIVPSFPDFSYSRDPDLLQLAKAVQDDTDNVEAWGKLVQAAEEQEGGLNRNSHPQAIASTRETYDYLLSRFPLFFGFWKKYAHFEWLIGGSETADVIFERGVACIGPSVDLWKEYCGFKIDTCHDPDIIRELFERATESAGLDFRADPLWDKYIEYEERLEDFDRVFAIHERLIHIPMHQYARYYEKYTNMAQKRPVEQLAPAEVIEMFRSDIRRENRSEQMKPADLERELRARCDALHKEIFHRTQTETTRRWAYEQNIIRPYFHTAEIDEAQLQNWRKYLDFEEIEGSRTRTRFLYERCLVTAALYDEFWLRYIRWTLSQTEIHEVTRREEVRFIFLRACCFFVPVSRPTVRLNYAKFEESLGNPQTAISILQNVLASTPGHVETLIALINVHRRSDGVNAAIRTLQECSARYNDASVRSALTVEHARLLWQVKGDVDAARKLFEDNHSKNVASPKFWIGWLKFEIAQSTSAELEMENHRHIKHVYDMIREKSYLPLDVIQDLTSYFLQYLEERGDDTAMKEFIDLDRESNGPVSVASTLKAKLAEDGKASTTHQRMVAENGHPGVLVNEAVVRQGGNPYTQYYAQQGEYGANGHTNVTAYS